MWMNQFKTVLLLAGLSGLFLFLGSLFGGMVGLQYALIVALVMNIITYFFSETIVLNLYRARPLDQQRYADIYGMVRELSGLMQIPMPKLWLIDNPMANAFATGRNPDHASVAFTTGILSLLEPYELRGVIAHELSHIKNRDILVSTVAATIATAIGYLAHMCQYAAFWGSLDNRRRGGNTVVMFLVSLFMPLAATLLQLAISRSREYLADESGSLYSRDPLALAQALKKLHHNIPHAHMNSEDTQRASTAPLFIVHPFTCKGWTTLFATHPPMEARIARLEQLHRKIEHVQNLG